MAELLSSARVLNSAEDELYEIYQEMQRIEILHQREKNRLNKLATRTTEDSKTMVRALNEIMTPANGKQAQVDIPFVLERVSKLLDTSNRVLQEADQILMEISIRYGKISTKLVKLEDKVQAGGDATAEYGRKLKQGIELTQEEQSTFLDVMKQLTATVSVCDKLKDFVYSAATGNWQRATGDAIQAAMSMFKNLPTLIEEHIERGEEQKTIGLLEEAKKTVEGLKSIYKKYSKKIGDARLDIRKRQKVLAERIKMLTKWHGVVEKIMDHWGDDDYKKLQDYMSTGNTFMLEEAISDFEQLGVVAQAYLDFDKNSTNTTAIP